MIEASAPSVWIAEELWRKGVALTVLDQSIDTSNATGWLLFNRLGGVDQFETELRAERQADGTARAKANGVAFGRKRALTGAEVTELRQARAQGLLIRELMARHGLSKALACRYLAERAFTPVEP